MSTRTIVGRVSFSPDHQKAATEPFTLAAEGTKFAGNGKRVFIKGLLRLPKGSEFSPVRFMKQLGGKVVKALRFVSARRRSSRKVYSSRLTRSHSHADSIESHRIEAVEDCIEFLHSSSCSSYLQRSSSVSERCYGTSVYNIR